MISLNTADFPRQDFVVIGGLTSPGRCQLRGAGTPRKWDERAGYGASGAWLIFMGNRLSTFEIDFYLWDRTKHPAAWQAFAGAVLKKAPKGKRPTPVTISHPILTWQPLEINQAVVVDVLQPMQDEKGGWLMTAKFQEYAGPIAFTVAKADTPPVPNAPPTPKDANEVEMAGINAQIAAAKARNP